MNPCKVTVMKDFMWDGRQYYAGSWIELTPGENMEYNRFEDLLETGALKLGVDQKFIDARDELNSQKNREKNV